jgi:hypothetical protein
VRKKIFIFSGILFIFLCFADTLSVWENISIFLFTYFLLDFLETLGKKIVILELTVIMASLTCLVMPVIFYHEYTRENVLARLWVKYMPVSSDNYFSFMVPAVIALAIGVRVPLAKSKINKEPRIYIDNVKRVLQNKSTLGLTLIAVGVTSGLLDFLSPTTLKQVFYFLDHLTFVGVFYVIYSPNRYKKIIVPSVVILMVGQSLITGMFGELIFILSCALVLILLGKKISLGKKILVAVAGIFLIIMIQSVKTDYRQRSWIEVGGADPAYYAELVIDRIADPATMLAPDRLFMAAVRTNQGWLVAMTMKKVPEKFDFAYGETIWKSIAGAIVPRFLWPDKPDAGGKANLKRFWGFNLVGFSMNIGPFGEAYANFDKIGGIFYMFFYGLFFNFILSSLLRLAEKRPTIVLWLPFLFYYSIGVETDLLSTMGSLMKGLIFTWIIFKIFRIGLQLEL